LIYGERNPPDELRDGLAVLSPRQDESLVIRRKGGSCADRLVDHQITTVILDRRLEPLDCIEQIRQLVAALAASESNAAIAEPARNLAFRVTKLVVARVERTRTPLGP
jgi:hypothetical protein